MQVSHRLTPPCGPSAVLYTPSPLPAVPRLRPNAPTLPQVPPAAPSPDNPTPRRPDSRNQSSYPFSKPFLLTSTGSNVSESSKLELTKLLLVSVEATVDALDERGDEAGR